MSHYFVPILLVIMLLFGCGKGSDAPKADCAINAGPCVRETVPDGLSVSFDIGPKPVSSMAVLTLSTFLQKKGRTVTDAKVTVDLSMPGMYMGENRVALALTESGRYEGRGILPRCPSGKRLWKAEVMVERPSRPGRTTTASFIFEVKN
ncbi:MAG: FixH family protein [Alphaproteobacteria bacterium]|uniref:FixH family protein n=1 Tax=Candidatus Nitrobium versatile TaxID=2884831 RepID=A0A953J5I8_9BACT|nr:FixH family protein [Candidatus Nitrobium versatile]